MPRLRRQWRRVSFPQRWRGNAAARALLVYGDRWGTAWLGGFSHTRRGRSKLVTDTLERPLVRAVGVCWLLIRCPNGRPRHGCRHSYSSKDGWIPALRIAASASVGPGSLGHREHSPPGQNVFAVLRLYTPGKAGADAAWPALPWPPRARLVPIGPTRKIDEHDV